MPIYESEAFTYDQMVKLAGTHKCFCGGTLTVAWDGTTSLYMLRCGRDIFHDAINEVDMTAYYQELNSKFGRRNKKLAQQIGTSKEVALRKYEYSPALTRDEAKEVALTLWPSAPDIEIKKVMLVCAQYRLNPLMKHVYLIGYNRKDKAGNIIGTDWTMVFGIKSKRMMAARAKPYSYADGTPRRMTDDEQITVFGEIDNANLVFITKLKDREGNIYPGYGRYPKAGYDPKGMDKGNSRENMGMIRSESNALDRLVPDGTLPENVEAVPEEVIEEQIRQDRARVTVEPVPAGERTVDVQTGEIVEGESQEVTEEGQSTEFEHLEGNGGHPVEGVGYNIQLEWLNDTLKKLVFEKSFPSWVKAKVPRIEIKGKSIPEIAAQFTPEEATLVVAGLRERAEIGKVQLT